MSTVVSMQLVNVSVFSKCCKKSLYWTILQSCNDRLSLARICEAVRSFVKVPIIYRMVAEKATLQFLW